MVFTLLLLLACADAQQTPCQQCCAPGGDCSKAYKGQPGTCCGFNAGRAYCSPAFTTGAKCWECRNAWRVFSGSRFVAADVFLVLQHGGMWRDEWRICGLPPAAGCRRDVLAARARARVCTHPLCSLCGL